MRLGLGVAFYKSTLSADGSSDEIKLSGTGTAIEMAFGGTVTPGLVLAGAITGSSVSEPEIEFGGTTVTATDGNVLQSNIGLLVDYYIDPESGFHIQGLIGYGIGTLSNDVNSNESTATGPVGQLGLGYEGWVGEQWGLGILGRITAASLTDDEDSDVKMNVLTPAILLTATLH